MTNDRRKTFATPLEFWQWAIMEPTRRKAKTPTGSVLWIEYEPSCANPIVCSLHGSMAGLYASRFPLTAVEDEHGVIPEAEPTEKRTALFDAIAPLASCATAREIVAAIRQEIDERIAAATVEYQQAHTNEWARLSNHRLKAKGE